MYEDHDDISIATPSAPPVGGWQYDANGNPMIGPIGWGITDLTPPTISITSPSSNATVSSTIAVTSSASDNVGVTKVEFYLDGVLETADTASPYIWNWNTASSSNGTHTIMAKAYDAAGNIGTSGNITVTVNNQAQTPPCTSFTYSGWGSCQSDDTETRTVLSSIPSGCTGGSPVLSQACAYGSAHSTTPSTTLPSIPTTLTATPVSQTAINLTWSPSTDTAGIAGYGIMRNGIQMATTTGTSYEDTNLTPGTSYSYTVDAYDALGTVSQESSSTSAMTEAAPITPVYSSGGGGGGGGSYYPTPITTPITTPAASSSISPQASVINSIETLLTELRSLVIQLLTSSNNGRPLTIGSKGTDVWALQVFLAIDGKGPASEKLASIGPTGTFGSITKAALAEYQSSMGITPSTGYFGQKTRAAIMEGEKQ